MPDPDPQPLPVPPSMPVEEGLPDDLEIVGDDDEIPVNAPVEVPPDEES